MVDRTANRSTTLDVDVRGIGVLGPGLTGWVQARAVLRGDAPYANAATAVPAPQRLQATERRRAGTIIKASIVAADEALTASGCDAGAIDTVFAASEGDGRNCHDLCEALASSDRLISPTRFTNSVHNAAAGYWHIATHAMSASTSLCAYDASFAMGLLEAVVQVRTQGRPVLLVVADAPYPEPLNATRPLPDAMAIAMVLAPAAPGRSHASLSVETRLASAAGVTRGRPELDTLVRSLPVARGLPLLEALACGGSQTCVVEGLDHLVLHVGVRGAAVT